MAMNFQALMQMKDSLAAFYKQSSEVSCFPASGAAGNPGGQRPFYFGKESGRKGD